MNLTVRIPPIVEMANPTMPKPKIKRGFAVRNFSACIVAPTETPRKMVMMFIKEPCADFESLSTTPLSFIKLPSINIPIRGTTAGIRSAITDMTSRGKMSFSRLETGRSCFITILRSRDVVSAFMMGGCMTGTIAMYV